MKYNYDTAVFGATFAGLGAAFACDGETLVIDSSPHICHEFVDCFNPGSGWKETPVSKEAKEIKKELIKRDILSEDGLVHFPALQPFMYNALKDRSFSMLLLTSVTSIKQTENGYEIELFNVSGYHTIMASRIIDTLGLNIFAEHGIKEISKSLNAILSGGSRAPVLDVCDVSIVKGKLENEYILKVIVDSNDDLVSARKKLHDFWSNRSDALREWTIAAVADYFDILREKKTVRINDTYSVLISNSFSNPLNAFDNGVRFVKEADFVEVI